MICYNKQTMKRERLDTTSTLGNTDIIPMTDKLMEDYNYFAGNQKDKSLELIQEVGQVPYLVKYQLDEDMNRYSHYLDKVDEDGYRLPDTSKIEADLLSVEQAKVKPAILKAINTMRVEVDGVGYDGDETATSRMLKAIQTLVGDEPITWKAYDNSEITITQTELGKALRASGIMMTKLWFCKSVEEVRLLVADDVEWLAKYEV